MLQQILTHQYMRAHVFVGESHYRTCSWPLKVLIYEKAYAHTCKIAEGDPRAQEEVMFVFSVGRLAMIKIVWTSLKVWET